MTDEQLVRELRRVKYCPTMTALAARAGLHRVTLYRAIKAGTVPAKHRASVERALQYATNNVYDNPRAQSH